MPPSTTRSATGGADVNTALLLHMDTATSRSGKRRVDEADTSAKSARTGDYHDVRPTYASASQTLDAMQELHPQLATAPDTSTAAPLVLDATLPFVLDAAAASTSASVPSSASAARLPLSASAPPTRARRSTARRQTRPLKPDQEKARAAFVAAHAGQTYEQMVLEHAYSSDRLFWLKEAYGLTWRTGRWSQDEEDRATDALNKFCKHYRLSQAALDELIWHRKPEQKHMHEELWKHIALSVGTRPNYAVRMHIKSLRKDVVRGGHWTQDEMEALASAVAELGHQWEKIGARLGRSGNVCKHFWREQMQSRSQGPVPQGAFRPEEEEALRQAVLECCEKVGCSPDGPNLPWTLIHERLGPSPRRISVLSRKWRGMLSAERRSSEEQNARWYAPHDDHILLQRIRAQGKQNAADIDFDQLATPEWQWPMYVIKKHWVVMLRKRAPPHFLGTLDELLDELARRVPSPEEYKMLASGRRPASAKAPHSTPVSASHDRGMPLPPPY
ncbi:DNA-binding transcription factor [Malassezia pachydermatis]